MNRKPKDAPDIVIDDGQVYESKTSNTSPPPRPAKPKRRLLSGIRKRLKPIYIGPLQPDQTGILNVRGHLGFVVLFFAMAAIGFAIFEAIPLFQSRGFYCPTIAVPFALLAIGLANSEIYAMKHKSISPKCLNKRLCLIGLTIGALGGLLGLCVNVIGIVFYFS